MAGRLKFEMWRYESKPGEFNGFKSRFTDGNGKYTESWWSNPSRSIDHAHHAYIADRHRNVKSGRHSDFIKQRYKLEMSRLRDGQD
ncbi:hypothetical protein [Paenibacillus oryzisoli]|uniref:Uncharacterized protein n=1 Tax=Paenibacillus oryzisoli TaxID=1850517 RepID=A0A198AEA2_9BACL|nr:hypothetical protein [Paenibacillus oryzisoli]OAS19273.1 hypothetical protein A8708_26550 [Paenibacillus oryzisoli]